MGYQPVISSRTSPASVSPKPSLAAPKRKPAARKTVTKRTPAAKSTTVLDTVFNIIKRNRNGVSIAALKAKTKLDSRQLSNALYKLSKKGQVRAKSRGVYVKK